MRLFYCTLVLCLSFGTALAQPNAYHGSWTLGAEDLDAGPISRDITVVGTDDVTQITGLSENCGGLIDADRSTVIVTFEGSTLHLSAAPSSNPEVDLVLALQRTDGSWLCADDTQEAESLNPSITLEDVDGEQLNVHVGRWGEHDANDAVEALIMAGLPGQEDLSGYMPGGTDGPEGGGGTPFSTAEFNEDALNFDSEATAELSVDISGEGDTVEMVVNATDTIPNPLVGDECRGAIPLEPALLVRPASEFDVLSILATSEEDGVMVVRTPGGDWFCSDDAVETNPGVQISEVSAGDYAVWVGPYNVSADSYSAQVSVTTDPLSDEPAMIPNPELPGSPATYGAIDPEADVANRVNISGEGDSEGVINVVAGGENGNPLSGSECRGFLSSAPSLQIALESDVDFLTLLGSVDTDAVMVLRAPGDQWYCSDDADGSNPGVQVNEAPAGDYLVWVGLFSESSEAMSGSVSVTTAPFSVDQMVPNPELPGSPATYEGELNPDASVEMTATLSGEGDSVDVDVVSTGEISNPLMGDECRGYLSADPTFRIQLENGVDVLSILATANADGVMAVKTPNDDWYCSDDAEGTNPGVQISQPATGDYAVWVGPYGSEGEDYDAEVAVTTEAISDVPEMVENPNIPGSLATYGAIDPTGEASNRVSITGEGDSAAVFNVTAGGESGNPLSGNECIGYLSFAPSLKLDLESGVEVLSILVNFDSDAVMVVRTPEDTWFCSDDAVGTNPGVQVNGADAGEYLVWVGAYSESSEAMSGSVSVTTEALSDAPLMTPNPSRAGSPATFGGTFDPDASAENRAILSGEGDSADVDVIARGDLANPLTGEVCHGYIPSAPSLQVQLESATEALSMLARLDADGVMVVQTPEDTWYCSDDAEGVNPGIQVDDAPAGAYSVWVGLFSAGSEQNASVSVTTASLSIENAGFEGVVEEIEEAVEVELDVDVPSPAPPPSPEED